MAQAQSVHPEATTRQLQNPPRNCTMITTLILLHIISTICSNHIVFEEIGKMIGAISYIHLVLPVDLPGLKERADQNIQRVWSLRQATLDCKFQWKGTDSYELQYTKEIRASYEEARSQHIWMFNHLEVFHSYLPDPT
jgi:hypothetical protein